MAFTNRKHRPESNQKRATSMRALYETGAPQGMGFPRKHHTEEDRRRARLSAQMKHRYGVTIDQFETICEAQGGKCAVCGEEKKLAMDHDHKTGAIRGALCGPCNRSLGFVDQVGLESIARYLRDERWLPDAVRFRVDL